MLKQTYQELKESGKGSLSTVEIAKIVSKQLKDKFPTCKFSVTSKYYSGGSSISISLMESNNNVIRDFNDISETALMMCESRRYTREQIRDIQNSKHHQLNQYGYTEAYNPNVWNNGVFLTEKGFNLFKQVVDIIESYNYDESDISTDYFSTNFYLHLSIGKWDKDYKYRNKI